MSFALVALAVVVPSVLVVLVGWANARRQPKSGDSPYRLPSGSPIAYLLFAVLALFVAMMVLSIPVAVVMALIRA